MYLSALLMLSAADAMGVNPDHVDIAPQLHVRDPRIEHIGWAVKAELEASEPFGRLYGESLGLALAAHLMRGYAPSRMPRGDVRLSRRRLQRVLDYIRDHLSQDLSLSELAELIGMSPSHFKVIFKQSMGLPVHRYVIRSRVEYATDLITRGKLSLSDVALQAGFANQSHMARSMKRLTGVTPSAVRC
jgi:AraC family transcriptional regulator